ncbi:hypothetical protein CN917_21250 [Bacillus thuringiensis]|uniref:hypothetical protein n=1 Tax=Bacillus cereus group TaxID=86661 RepID=UPI000BFE1F1A|nr:MULTISPECIES: hypothetical protein [Bacillus cereus group]MED2614695.1 hypothetical protein [Bacillus toyonensis]MED3313527.1 hypothetical protein [Bacillus thuringiensis]PGL18325.1 hypothetical protein CN917_21250 [Bacillus thuringiensis]
MELIYYTKSRINSLYLSANDSEAGWRGFQYLTPPDVLPDQLTLQASWCEVGIYFFAPYQPTNLDQFHEKMNDYLRNNVESTDKHILLWVHNPNVSTWTDDNTNLMRLAEIGPVGELALVNDFNYGLGHNFQFYIPSESGIIFDNSLQHIAIEAPFAREITFVAKDEQDNDVTNVMPQTVYLPFDGPDRGSLRFKLRAIQNRFYDVFSVRLKYFYPDGGSKYPAVLNFPMFKKTDEENYLNFDVAIDPVDPWDARGNSRMPRTFLAFTSENPNLYTYYSTQFGHEVSLQPSALFVDESSKPYKQPKDDCALLVFSPQIKDEIISNYPVYTVPRGAYHIIVSELVSLAPMLTQILCGLTGTETIECVPKSAGYNGDTLWFQPNMPAYAPSFSISGSIPHDSSTRLLRDDCLTSWMTVRRLEPRLDLAHLRVQYLSQPEDDSLFRLQSMQTSTTTLYQPVLVDLTAIHENFFFPVVPLAGVINDFPILLEEKILSLERKEIMDAQSLQLDNLGIQIAGEDGESLTPQGLLVKEQNRQWSQLILAKNEEAKVNGNAPCLQFNGVGNTLRNALLTSQLFLVISQEGSYDEFLNQIPIANWPFRINISSSNKGEYRNVFVIKYCDGSLDERIQDPKKWTKPHFFNEDPDDLSEWLTTHCHNIDRTKKNTAKFLEVLQNPSWNGIIAFKVDVRLDAMPADLSGLLAGFNDPSALFAHHFGIQFNRVIPKGDGTLGLEMEKISSMFAYIDYKDETCETPPLVHNFEFKVCKLEVLFDNSQLTNFDAELQLKVDGLFGSTIDGGSKIVKFKGNYENHDGVPTYSFYSTNPIELKLNNKILEGVTLSKATFKTIKNDPDEIQTRFSFWGNLQFSERDDMDVFSYKNLPFSDLGIGMNLPKSLGRLTNPSFSFDAGQMTVDLGQSVLRSGSFANKFPIQLTGFKAGISPASLETSGFKGINLRSSGRVSQNLDLEEEWYGLEYSLDLGSLGHLSSANSLRSDLVIAWSASGNHYLGLRIPNLGMNQPMMSLEQVLNTHVNGLRLGKKDNAYYLLLENVSHNFLGKTVQPSQEREQISIFVDPNAESALTSLGWYMAFTSQRTFEESGSTEHEIITDR